MNATPSTATRPEITAGQASDLLRQVRTASQGSGSPEEVTKLRDALEPRIIACNYWLALLGEWVRRGLIIEAASVNDSFPELCKVAHVLAMPDDRLAWDQACNRAGVAPNTRIDEQAYLELSDAIADASSLDEFVQRFQLSVIGRKPLPARIRALQGLLSAAPRNDAVRGLARRFESEALASLEEGCRAAAAAGRHEELVDALEAIDGLGWDSQFSNEFMEWLRGQIALRNRAEALRRFEHLAPRIEAAFVARDLMLLGALSEEWEQAEREHGVEPTDALRSRTRDAIGWAESERERLRIASDHAEQCESMRRALDQGYPYLELEPIRGRILRLGLGVPDDIEARYETAHATWRTARRRRAATVVGLAVLAIACVTGITGYFAWQRSERQRAEVLGARIAAMLDEGDFAEARAMLAEVAESESWMLEVPEVGGAERRFKAEEPKYEERRRAIAAMIKSSQGTSRSDTKALEASVAALAAALERTAVLERPTPDEARSLRGILDELRDALVAISELARQQREDEFSEIRRAVASIPPVTERAPADRLSPDATEAYLRSVQAAEQRARAYVNAAPVHDENRTEAQSMIDRLGKDAAAAAALIPRLKEGAKLLDRLRLRPESESEYLALLDTIAEQHADMAATADGQRGAAIAEARKMARAAAAIEHWRNQVIVPIKAADPSGRVSIPMRQQEAAAIASVLQSHIDGYPGSPFRAIAESWKLLCERAASASSESAAQDALQALDATGLLRLRQVSLAENRWAFVRDDSDAKGTLSGLVQTLQDLTCPAGHLRVNLDLVRQHAGVRQPTPWFRVLGAPKDQLLGLSMVDAQAAWLRLMASVQSSNEPTEDIARAMVVLALWEAYASHLAIPEGADQKLVDRLERLKKGDRSFVVCDWPRLSIKPPGDIDRQGQQASARRLLANEMADFATNADERLRTFQKQVDDGKPAFLAGLLLPRAPGEEFRRCSPAELNGDAYEVLALHPDKQSWALQRASFEKGVLKSGAANAPSFALIYIRK
jgi:hypothetical protein